MRRALLVLGSVLVGLMLVPAAASAAPRAPATAPATAAEPGRALDARAAAGRTVKEGAATNMSWYTGTVPAYGTQYWIWYNATPLSSGFRVGLSPTGASTTTQCHFAVQRSWYSQESTGERRFHMILENRSSLACGATVLLAQTLGSNIGATGSLAPGASQHWYWNIADTITNRTVQQLGISPTGATAGAPCQIEMTKTWNVDSGGSSLREFHFVVKNVGTIPCGATLYLASWKQLATSFALGDLAPGATVNAVWYNANPVSHVYVPRVAPFLLLPGMTCILEAVEESYVQRVSPTGAPERQFWFSVRNTGTQTCRDLRVYLPSTPA